MLGRWLPCLGIGPLHLCSLPFLRSLARLGSPSLLASVFNVGSTASVLGLFAFGSTGVFEKPY